MDYGLGDDLATCRYYTAVRYDKTVWPSDLPYDSSERQLFSTIRRTTTQLSLLFYAYLTLPFDSDPI